MSFRRLLAASALGSLLVLVLACGGSDFESCETRGATDECGANAICDEAEGEDGPVCLTICEDQEDCDAGFSCNGVSGSNIKACHPEGDDDGSDDLDGDGDDGDGKDKDK
jgi:hypothetical protein